MMMAFTPSARVTTALPRPVSGLVPAGEAGPLDGGTDGADCCGVVRASSRNRPGRVDVVVDDGLADAGAGWLGVWPTSCCSTGNSAAASACSSR